VDIVNLVTFGQFKGRDSGVIIKLGRDIIPLSIVTKFHEDPIKTVLT